jgi:hypothetical protein
MLLSYGDLANYFTPYYIEDVVENVRDYSSCCISNECERDGDNLRVTQGNTKNTGRNAPQNDVKIQDGYDAIDPL